MKTERDQHDKKIFYALALLMVTGSLASANFCNCSTRNTNGDKVCTATERDKYPVWSKIQCEAECPKNTIARISDKAGE